jgi:hypothetical protein
MLVKRIQMKTSSTPGDVPGVMQHGEMAVNLPDAKLYVGVDGAAPIVIGGATPSVLDEGPLP